MLDQGGGHDALCIEHRRVRAIHVKVLPGLATEVIRYETGNVRSAYEAHQIRYAGAHRRSFESMCLCDDPGSHKATIAPTHDSQPFRVGHAHLDYMVHPGHQILIVTATPVLDVRVAKLLAIAGRTAWVDAQDCIALRNKRGHWIRRTIADQEGLGKDSGRATVDDQQQRN